MYSINQKLNQAEILLTMALKRLQRAKQSQLEAERVFKTAQGRKRKRAATALEKAERKVVAALRTYTATEKTLNQLARNAQRSEFERPFLAFRAAMA